MLAGLLLGACGQSSASTTGEHGASTATPTAHTQTSGAGSLAVWYTPRELAERSDLVVVATVEGRRVVHDGGSVPGDGPGATVATATTVAVERVVRDPRHLVTVTGARLVVRTQGGPDGNVTVSFEDEPAFTAGERVVLFLTAIGDGRYRCANGFEGALPVRDGMVQVMYGAPETEEAFLAELQGA
jgi:hypothetical protein